MKERHEIPSQSKEGERYALFVMKKWIGWNSASTKDKQMWAITPAELPQKLVEKEQFSNSEEYARQG